MRASLVALWISAAFASVLAGVTVAQHGAHGVAAVAWAVVSIGLGAWVTVAAGPDDDTGNGGTDGGPGGPGGGGGDPQTPRGGPGFDWDEFDRLRARWERPPVGPGDRRS